MTLSWALRIASVVSGTHSRLACSNNRECIFFSAVSSVTPSEVLGRIIIMNPPDKMPTMTSQTRDWAIVHSSFASVTLITGKAMIAQV